jgi:hypothetical protein
MAFDLWMADDLDRARSWFSRLPNSSQRADLGNRLAAGLAIKGDLEGAMKLFSPAPGEDCSDALEAIANAKAGADRKASAEWLAGLPAQVEMGDIPKWNVHRWVDDDPAAAAQWIESLPAGAFRDKAVQGLSERARSADPFVAAEWATRIGDPKIKMEMITNVFQEMWRHNPGAARSWLQNMEGIDPVWRDHLLKMGL